MYIRVWRVVLAKRKAVFSDAGRDVRLDEPGRKNARARGAGGVLPAGVRVARRGHVTGWCSVRDERRARGDIQVLGQLRRVFGQRVPPHDPP